MREQDQDSMPADYVQPSTVWLVEYVNDNEPGMRYQAGAFTSEAEADKLLAKLRSENWASELRINVVPVHRTVADWMWDR